MRPLIYGLCLSTALSGCATAPANTPGAGTGDTYTPFVDLQGVDPTRYSSDLDSCRSYARQIDPNKKAMEGMLGGIILGAMIGAAVGGSRYHAEHAAMAGGTAGVGAGGAKAIVKQETILANCMAGRGYRVLEGATQPTNMAVASPYTYGTQQQAGVAGNNTAGNPMPAGPTGQDAGNVERYARQWACNSTPLAVLQTKGPGFETYTVRCVSGDTWRFRCEFGNCQRTG